MLIIEVDGSIHKEPEVSTNDTLRQQALEDQGFTVLRFTNHEVLHHIHEVGHKLTQWIQSYEHQNNQNSQAPAVI